MPTVFVIQDDGSKNLSSALEFGNIHVLEIRDMPINRDNTRILHRLRHALSDFCADDYLLLTGDPLLIGSATHFAARAAGGSVNCLKWDRQTKTYFPVTLDLDGVPIKRKENDENGDEDKSESKSEDGTGQQQAKLHHT